MARAAPRRTLGALALAAALLATPRAGAQALNDVPVAGDRLTLRASPQRPNRRAVEFRSADAAIAAPFADPTAGASLLVFASNGTGQCRVETALPAGNWKPIRRDGANRGWRYRDPGGSAQGIRKVVVAPRRVVVAGRGGAFPCGLEATQREPVAVVLRLGGTRYCAAFGGTVTGNRVGGFRAKAAPAPAACPDTADVTLATLNVLHGLFCPSETVNCRVADRVDLLGQWILGRGCPDLVALQEVTDVVSLPALVEGRLLDVCPFRYEVVFPGGNPFDNSLLLTRYPVLTSELHVLHVNFRNVLYARLDHPIGPVDVFSTHLASRSDGGPNPCGSAQFPCPSECTAGGAATVRECQALQVADFVAERHDVGSPALVVGDFNAPPGSFEYRQFTDRGWVDAYLAAGNPECDPATGTGCTSGREDEDLVDLESPALGVDERIDYVFLLPPGPGTSCAGALDSGADADGDGVATRHFADEPNPFAPSCGAAPDPLCWVSDHNGVQVDVNCE
jgi:endonuclease/exonuclease/phosphatase family metal-dependent hydrolase